MSLWLLIQETASCRTATRNGTALRMSLEQTTRYFSWDMAEKLLMHIKQTCDTKLAHNLHWLTLSASLNIRVFAGMRNKPAQIYLVWADNLDPSIAKIPTQPTSKLKLSHFLLSRHPILQWLIYHQAWILILTQIFQFFISSHNLTTPM